MDKLDDIFCEVDDFCRVFIPIPLNYCPLVLVKIIQEFVALNSNSQLLLNRAPYLDLFSFAQQDHKLNGIGISVQV